MTTKDNLPEPVKQETAEVAVFTPPGSFEVIDRGPGEKVEFGNFGDSFIGIFEHIEDYVPDEGKPFPIARFLGADGLSYVIIPGAGLIRPLQRLKYGDWVRITYTYDVDTGKPSPMKCFTVEVGR